MPFLTTGEHYFSNVETTLLLRVKISTKCVLSSNLFSTLTMYVNDYKISRVTFLEIWNLFYEQDICSTLEKNPYYRKCTHII